jgi:hypothetical protein
MAASKSGEKRLCRLICGKPLAFRRRPLPSSPRLGWKAKPSSRGQGVSQGGSPRKGEAFPHIRRQSRFGKSVSLMYRRRNLSRSDRDAAIWSVR